MAMAVYQTWKQPLSMEIDKLCLLANCFLNIHPTAHRNNFVVADSHCFSVRTIGFTSEDSRIIEDAFWRIVSNSYSGPKKQSDDQNRQRKILMALHSGPLSFGICRTAINFSLHSSIQEAADAW